MIDENVWKNQAELARREAKVVCLDHLTEAVQRVKFTRNGNASSYVYKEARANMIKTMR
jgi:hypothetical protein